MTLYEQRVLFTHLLARLIMEAFRQGYTITLGEVYRSAAEAKRLAATGAGIAKSLHTEGLAADINLYRNGVYLKDTLDYLALGQFWEQMHSSCRWGGRFKTRPDGNHFSIAYGGRQ